MVVLVDDTRQCKHVDEVGDEDIASEAVQEEDVREEPAHQLRPEQDQPQRGGVLVGHTGVLDDDDGQVDEGGHTQPCVIDADTILYEPAQEPDLFLETILHQHLNIVGDTEIGTRGTYIQEAGGDQNHH